MAKNADDMKYVYRAVVKWTGCSYSHVRDNLSDVVISPDGDIEGWLPGMYDDHQYLGNIWDTGRII
jgi:hypothetical protein